MCAQAFIGVLGWAEIICHQWVAVLYPFSHWHHPTPLDFVCVMVSSRRGLLLLQQLLVSWPHIKSLCSSNGALVLRSGVRSSSETCVGSFIGHLSKGSGQDRAVLLTFKNCALASFHLQYGHFVYHIVNIP